MKTFLVIIMLLILCFTFNIFGAGVSQSSDVNSIRTENSEAASNNNENPVLEFLMQPFNILFGFILGLFGTVFINYLQQKQKAKEFFIGVRTELKQILGMVNFYTFNSDAELNSEKILLFKSLIKEFDLIKIMNPLGETPGIDDLVNRDLSEEDIQQIVELRRINIAQRRENDRVQRFKLLKCNYIINNISSISLLPLKTQAYLMNILRKIEAINEIMPSVEFCFQKSYDANVSQENRERLKRVYEDNCQSISDFSYDTAKEIANFLRL